MRCTILHETRGRIRIHITQSRVTLRQADCLDDFLTRLDGVQSARVYERTGDAVIVYRGDRDALLLALSRFHFLPEEESAAAPSNTAGQSPAGTVSRLSAGKSSAGHKPTSPKIPSTGREITRYYQERLVFMTAFRFLRRLFLPVPLRIAYTVVSYWPCLKRGLAALFRRQMRVEILDALSVGISLARGDFNTAESIMYLLRVGELLEEWTHKKSVDNLARSMALHIDRVWKVTPGGDILTPIQDIRTGDHIRVRTGSLIPVDGKVISGETTVNQASLTGESVPVPKHPGSMVYAGTVLEEGECVMEAAGENGSSRYDRIVTMIEESQKLSSETEHQAARLADKLVPFSLCGMGLTYLLTRNATRAVSILMVDFSCALKLSMPLAFLSAMGEAGRRHITVKGGKFLEAAANADTVVFDKTGTLTRACPTVADVVAFGDHDPVEMLRVAACLEEHFPHSIANAVVRCALERGLDHREMHADVEYLVAHGISSSIGGRRVVVGSYHFVFEDEHCEIPSGEQTRFDALPDSCSHLYLAIGGQLAAVILVTDPLRPEAREVIEQLRALGISRLVMMTGDSERTAAAIAAQAGVDEYHAEVLPEDKAAFVEQERAAGHTVLMIGDGINDTPALSAADAGIAISDGAAIAREVADITVASDSLYELAALRRLSMSLMRRVRQNYRFVMGFNGSLMLLGALGILNPAGSALLHNLSTLLTGIRSMTRLLENEDLLSPGTADCLEDPVV